MSSSQIEQTALMIEPSGSWLGDDGSWSGFEISIGTPPQNFTVFPATSGHHVYVPVADDCQRIPRSDCAQSRGVATFDNTQSPGFQQNASSTWKLIGLYEMDMNRNWEWSGNAITGYETIGFGERNNVPNYGKFLKDEVVTAYATPDIWVGQLGLGATTKTYRQNERVSSFLTHLKEKHIIPSESFGYTAGASHRSTKVAASLTLGGYDRSRISNPITIPISSDDEKPLSIHLQSIVASNTLNGTLSLLHDAILTPIDSSLPELWLPEPVCDKFASAFGLTYQNHSGRYAISDASRAALRELSPTLTFTVADSLVEGKSTNIHLPYAAFDLKATYPIFPNSTNYFPIRRAENETQFGIGRTFLQEAYIAVDYERKQFDIGQAVFATPMPQADIVTIWPSDRADDSDPRGGGNRLSTGQIAGTVVGAVLGVVVFAAVGWYVFSRSRNRKKGTVYANGSEEAKTEAEKSEIGGAMIGELSAYHGFSEATQEREAVEMPGGTVAHELE